MLPHDHIVEVLDFQITPDRSYGLVMEFLYGEELRATLAREKYLSPARLVRMLSQSALGLDGAHTRKLVHRDLKPDNIFLVQTPEGDRVKILDFGSVKDKADNAKKLTVMGTTIGSPFYMAPEQAQGLDTLDHRADVWALAAIAYECLAGTVPFKGANGPTILLEILTREPQPLTKAAMAAPHPVPPGMDLVIQNALRKSAAMRIPTVGALADALGHAYGLSGEHREWAVRSQQELEAEIAAKLPELMTRQPVKPAGEAPIDSFFGESDALGEVADPFAPPPQAGHDPRPVPRVETDLEIPRLPTHQTATVVVVVVIAILGVLLGVALILFLRS
jgi:serine/threonine-protein kinase